MSADIRLEEGEGKVVVTGSALRVEAADLVIDAYDRRKVNTGLRRAMVHDQNDGLTLNFNGDYPGGVTINGMNSLVIKGDLQFRIAHNNGNFGHGHGPFGDFPIHELDEVLSLAQVIVDLRKQIAELRAKVGI